MFQFDHCQLPLTYMMVQHHPGRNPQHENLQTTFDMFGQSQQLLQTLYKSFFVFLHFSWVFTFLEIIKHIMPKCCLFSSICNIKMAMQKFTNFDKSFKCKLTWQLSQCNLTTVFQMKLKTIKHYYSPLLKKKKTFWPIQ